MLETFSLIRITLRARVRDVDEYFDANAVRAEATLLF